MAIKKDTLDQLIAAPGILDKAAHSSSLHEALIAHRSKR
jgi:hypothetical protein